MVETLQSCRPDHVRERGGDDVIGMAEEAQCGDGHPCVGYLVRSDQPRHRKLHLPVPIPEAQPAVVRLRHIPIDTAHVERAADGSCTRSDGPERLGRLAADHRRRIWLEDARLLCGDRLERLPEKFGVVEAHRGNHAEGRSDAFDVGGVQPATHPYLEQ